MNRLLQMALLLPALCGWSALQTADAACMKTNEEIGAMPEFHTFDQQLRSTFRHPEEMTAERTAAHAGHLLGWQARFLGRSKERRDKFDCIFRFYQTVNAGLAMAFQVDPLDVDRIFKGAAWGALDDAELRRYGVDPTRKFPPIFDMGIAGLWRNQRQPSVGMVVEETEEGRYRCRSFGAAQSGGEQNCAIEQVGEQDFVMSFVMPPFGKQTQPQNVRIPLHREGDRLATPGPAYSLIYVRDRSAEGG